jgi:hypothetical protein
VHCSPMPGNYRAIMEKRKIAGRPPLPVDMRRINLCVRVLPMTLDALHTFAASRGSQLGQALDWIIINQVAQDMATKRTKAKP